MARRPNQTGSVYQRRDGRWCVALTLPSGKRLVRYAPDRKAALDLLAELSPQRAVLTPPARLTLAAFAERWLEAITPQTRASTRANYRAWLRWYVLPDLGRLRLDRVTPLQVATLLAQLRARGLSVRTVGNARQALHKLYSDAVAWGMVRLNPASPVKPPKGTSAPRARWTLEETQRFARYLEQRCDHYGAMWTLGLYGGLRPGEALGATWDNLEGAVLHIRQAAVWVQRTLTVGPPKSRAGSRSITLPQPALVQLERWRLRQKELRLQTGHPWPDAVPIVTSTGATVSEEDARKALRRACQRLGLPVLPPHALRRVHAALLVAAGADIKTAQARLGHATSAMTLDTYSYPLPGRDALAAQGVGDLVGYP